MRVVRIGDETSTVGADVRAALTSWGRGESVVGGVALVGLRPKDSDRVIDAVVVLPRGVLVVVGVDLPDPAVRLDAPLSGQWKTDGWPLTRPDGAVNPAAEAVAVVGVVSRVLEAARTEPLPVGTVVAVGPYVSQVHQPTSDLLRGVRILHPEPKTLLNAARELAVHQRPCTVAQARAIIAALAPDLPEVDLAGEGFAGAATPELGAASTTLIPRAQLAQQQHPAGEPRQKAKQKPLRWLPAGAAVLVALLLLTGIVYAVASSGSADESGRGTTSTRTATNGVTVDGRTFEPKGTITDTDCAAHAYGDVQVWLERNRCSELVRARYESTSDGKRAAVLVSVLRFPQTVLAGELNAVADKPGSGAIADASTEGEPWPGKAKPFFESAAFASGREGNSLKLVQAVWIGEPSTTDDEDLTRIATSALEIQVNA
ncbi:hypothetical protein [Actinophytocola glycyrrhizae]|uniref:NERD domain-containing protein n=1 Tax=Actinophytocola glycyrrhizae TaxID=2044873 RepID=A0ABV9SD86_9PSEU